MAIFPFQHYMTHKKRFFAATLLCLTIVAVCLGQIEQRFDFYSRGEYRPNVPRPQAILRYDVGDFHTTYAQMEQVINAIAAAAPDVVAVCAFGALLREPLLSEHELLNVHPSLLPRWRGAAPIERAIMAGDAETGVAIMRVTAGLDSGPVCLVERTAIAPDDTYGTLSERLARAGGDLLVRALDERPECREQDDALATYAEKIGAEDRRLDAVSRPATELERVVRALTPHVGAFLELPDGSRLGVRGARLATGPAPSPGRLAEEGGRLVLGCARSSALELLVVQPPGGRLMGADEYLRGHSI